MIFTTFDIHENLPLISWVYQNDAYVHVALIMGLFVFENLALHWWFELELPKCRIGGQGFGGCYNQASNM